MPCSAVFSVRNTTFNRNAIGIRLGQETPVCSTPLPIFSYFSENTFNCTAPLNGTNGDISTAGMQMYGVTLTLISYVPSVFKNMLYGVKIEKQDGLAYNAFNGLHFEKIYRDGVYAYEGKLRLKLCKFKNCATGVNVILTSGLSVEGSEFTFDDNIPSNFLDSQPPIPNSYLGIVINYVEMGSLIEIGKSGIPGLVADNKFKADFLDLREELVQFVKIISYGTSGVESDIRISHNKFDLRYKHSDSAPGNPGSSTQEFMNTGIHLMGNFPASTNFTIAQNEFFLDNIDLGQNGSSSSVGISCSAGSKSNLNISTNSFSSNSFSTIVNQKTSGENGFFLTGSMLGTNNTIQSNFFVEKSLGNIYHFAGGVVSTNFTNTEYSSNIFRECAGDMTFSGFSLGTDLLCNTLIVHASGLLLDETQIGVQGMSADHQNGNKIYSKSPGTTFVFGNGGHALFKGTQSQMLNSRFYIENPQSAPFAGAGAPGFNEYYPWMISVEITDPVVDPDWFKGENDLPFAMECDASYLNPSDYNIALSNPATSNLLENYIEKFYLYQKIRLNPGVTGSNSVMQAFASAHAQDPVGLRYAIHEKIQEALSADNTTLADLLSLRISESILLDALDGIDAQLLNETSPVIVDGLLEDKRAILLDLHNNSVQHLSKVNQWKPDMVQKLLAAQSLNNSFASSVPFQQDEITVCAIFLNMVLQERDASTSEKLLLTPIATLCPKVGGPAVFFARALLNGCDQPLFNDTQAGCFAEMPPPMIGEALERSEKENEAIPTLSLYPNPANSQITIISADRFAFCLEDLSGRQLLSDFTPANERVLDLGSVADGFYILRLQLEGGNKMAKKIVVSH